jgi:biotin synthase
MKERNGGQSPEFVKISCATAISLGLSRGWMHKGAVNRCVNILVHYNEGCSANCAYCGLAKRRPGNYRDKSFIHVVWPVIRTDELVKAIKAAPPYVRRSCISMITNGKCPAHTLELAEILLRETSLPVSVLLSPTVMEADDLFEMKRIGVDKVGIALDLATEELFDRYRGKGVGGPHKWGHYWEFIHKAVEVFGVKNVGAHLMVGMGETEEDMVHLMSSLYRYGVINHLFSFFAEEGSALGNRPQPPWPVYLRIQLARYLIEEGMADFSEMGFDDMGRILDFGCPSAVLQEAISRGVPFMTTGCIGSDGNVSCNRPFGNCLPGEMQWNYPYPPDSDETALIREHLMER